MKLFKLAGTFSALALVASLGMSAATVTHAASIASFDRVTNAGVFNLSSQQAELLGASTADRMGLVRIRQGEAGDTFDADSIFASVKSNSGAILGLRNGSAAALNYTGNEFDTLGLTTLAQDFTSDDRFAFDPGIYLLFKAGTGDIVFGGSAVFNGTGNNKGDFDGLTPVPLPAAGWLLLAGLGGLGVASRRRRKAA